MLSERDVAAVVSRMSSLDIIPAPIPQDHRSRYFWLQQLENTDVADSLCRGKFSSQELYCKVHSLFVSSRLAFGLLSAVDVMKYIREFWYEQPFKPQYRANASFGQKMEPPAISLYHTLTRKIVKRCKNVINPKIPFLIASPVGLVFDRGNLVKAIEIKTITEMTSYDEIGLVRCCVQTRFGLQLKRHTSTYSQMQFTMLCLNLDQMDLVLYFPKLQQIEVVSVKRDTFFLNTCLPKLYHNYVHHLIPYLVSKINELE